MSMHDKTKRNKSPPWEECPELKKPTYYYCLAISSKIIISQGAPKNYKKKKYQKIIPIMYECLWRENTSNKIWLKS